MFVPIKFLAGNIFDIDPVANIKYDKIYCGAGCNPEQAAFFKQLLDVNGQLLAPVTDASGSALMRYTRSAGASSPAFTSEKLMGVRFADLIPSSAAPSQPKLVLESSSNSRSLPNPHAPSTLPSHPSPSPSGFLRTLSSSSSSTTTSSSSAAAPEVFLSINVRSSGAIASRCVSFLQAHGIRAWLCTQDLAGGANFREEIVRAVRGLAPSASKLPLPFAK
jgi:hypothetical protein